MAREKRVRVKKGERHLSELDKQNLTVNELAIRNVYWNVEYILNHNSGRLGSEAYTNRKNTYCGYWDANTGGRSSVWVALTNGLIQAGADPLRTMLRLHRWSWSQAYPMKPNQAIVYCSRTANSWFLPTPVSIQKTRLAIVTTFSRLKAETEYNLRIGRTENDSVLLAVRLDTANPLVTYTFGCMAGYPHLVAELLDAAVNYYINYQSELNAICDFGIPPIIKEEAATTRSLYYS